MSDWTRNKEEKVFKEELNVDKILEGQIGTQKLWPGVENTPAIVGFQKASELAFQNFEENVGRMQALRDKLINGIIKTIMQKKAPKRGI